jgi:hypothetical protein
VGRREQDIETFSQPAGRSNGLFFTPAGQLIACADGKNELWSINIADKTHQVLLSKYQDRLFNGPTIAGLIPMAGSTSQIPITNGRTGIASKARWNNNKCIESKPMVLD